MRERGKPTIAVVGGGITGLAAAHSLRNKAHVVLLEAGSRLGGKIHTFELGGASVEAGPDSFLARDDHPLRLCRSLGIEEELVEPAKFGAWLWIGGRLKALPPGSFMGIPTSPVAVLRSRVLSARGLARAAADLVLPGRVTGSDVALGAYVRRRLGGEVLERLVDPLMAGVRAGDVDEMSLRAAAPEVYEIAASHRSLTLGLRAARRSGRLPARPRFFSFDKGMQTLVDAFVSSLGEVEMRTETFVDSISPCDEGFTVGSAGGSTVRARGVVVAVPADVAARILTPLSPHAADALGSLSYAPAAVATFIFGPGLVMVPADGSGFLVPNSEGRTISACTWFSAKWSHAAPVDGSVVLRCFAGRSSADPSLARTDDDLIAAMQADAAAALGIRAAPTATHLTRWSSGLPELRVGHLERLDAAERALARWPGIALGGAGYRGTGIAECMKQGQGAARRVLQAAGAMGR